ncbi:MAG TPA: asparagine synthase-related protein [Bacteroidales bacterium]|jgi:asparagine synthase (glutamine-hydrolysing)|nr:asparagine synthase-related protein [Bacteroidales bacterium]
MPPIFGILSTNLDPVNSESLGRMTADATYIKTRKILKWEKRGYFMATAILDDGGKEVSSSGPWVCIADAKLYKRVSVDIDNLHAAESILQAWMKWKQDCVKHLYGDFAFVIFNTETGEIFCSRDHMGVRPLFYSFIDKTLIFATELRLVLAAMPEKQEVRADYLLDTLVTQKTNKSLSPFETIMRLPPAHSLHISGGRMISEEYWKLDAEKRIRLGSERDYIELLHEKLVNAVGFRCKDGNIGAELSGGLDSSAVTGIAATFLEKEKRILSTYSNVFPLESEMDCKDEREFMLEMIRFKSLKWLGIDSLKRDIPGLLQRAVTIQGCYIQQNFSMLSEALYEAAGRDNVRVLLSGFGGDEMTSSRTAVQWNELIREREWQFIKEELFYKGVTIRSLAKAGTLPIRYFLSIFKRSKFTSGVFTKDLLDSRFDNIPLQPEFARANQIRQRLGDQYRRKNRNTLSMKQFDRIMHDHIPQRIEYCYVAAAQYGIEYRYPLLDIDLLETFLAFPPWLKQHNGINRYAFRQAIKGFVPELIRWRNDKSGATIPQTLYSLVKDREKIMEVINRVSELHFLNTIFDFSRFPGWYERLVKRDPKEINYLMQSAFFSYLMMVLYYMKNHDPGTKDHPEEKQ